MRKEKEKEKRKERRKEKSGGIKRIMIKYLNVPFSKEECAELKIGDYVYLTGTIYTARDAAHKRMQESIDRNESLPFDIEGQVIYYMGPSPAREGKPIGSAGPTTSGRMDKYTPPLRLERSG